MLPLQHCAGREMLVLLFFHVLFISICLGYMLTTYDQSVQCQSVHWPYPNPEYSDEHRWTHQSAWLAPLHPWAKQHSTAGSIWYYVTQHHPRRPCSHHLSPPTPPPTSALLAICRQRCIVRQECSSTDTTCRNICGEFSFRKLISRWNPCSQREQCLMRGQHY